MKNNTKGNQKHLTLSQRIDIEKGLRSGDSFAVIARRIGKDPSTVSKEVRKHSKVKERKNDFAKHIPCANRKGCTIQYLCNTSCDEKCSRCTSSKISCMDICPNYEPRVCTKLSKPPYVCNGCAKITGCLMERKVYSSKYADDCYREVLVSAREGINQTPESIIKMDELVSPLIQKGQSIAHIYAHHADEIGCSRRTIYNYIDQSVLTVRNLDLRRRVKYKPRRKSTKPTEKDRAYRINRNYDDFQQLTKDNPNLSIVEMDTVEGEKGGKVFLTMLFRNCTLMLMFLLESKTQSEVTRIFNEITDMLGVELFNKIFQVILTDGGSEFQNPNQVETTASGKRRTSLYYCDPYCSWQKGAIEKNHEYIRLVLPKGSTFNHLTKEQVTLLQNHINSEARDSLNSCSPYKLSQLLLDNKLHHCLDLVEIEPDDVYLKPELLK